MTEERKARRIKTNPYDYCENCSYRTIVVRIATETHISCENCGNRRIVDESDTN